MSKFLEKSDVNKLNMGYLQNVWGIMNKFLKIIAIVFPSMVSSAQSDSSVLVKVKPVRAIKYIKSNPNTTSNRYDCQDYWCRNKRLRQTNEGFYFDVFNDSNILVSTHMVAPYVHSDTVTIPDSIPALNANRQVLGDDTIFPGRIVVSKFYYYFDGPFTEYYNNGRIKLSGHYKHWTPDKVWVFYNEDGTINKKFYYRKGLLRKSKILMENS